MKIKYRMEGGFGSGKIGKFTATTYYLAEENLVNFVHSQNENYENFVA